MIGQDISSVSRPMSKKHHRPAGRPQKRLPDPSAEAAADAPSRGERLQKVLAAAGIASRRECEQIVLEGRVEVDGQVVTRLGTRVDPQNQVIRVDGTALPRTRLQYYIINKPQGVVTTSRDPWARTRVIDLAPEKAGRLFAVGRLDMSSEGLVLLTNDGDLANRLAHPRYGIEKTYQVQVAGDVSHDVMEKLRSGVWLAEGRVKPERAHISRRYKQSTILEIVLREGKNREIRRMLAALGHKVQRLRRVAIGPLKLGELPLGQARALEHHELQRLKTAAHRPPGSEAKSSEEATSANSPSRVGAHRYPSKRPGTQGSRRTFGKSQERGQGQRPATRPGGPGGRGQGRPRRPGPGPGKPKGRTSKGGNSKGTRRPR